MKTPLQLPTDEERPQFLPSGRRSLHPLTVLSAYLPICLMLNIQETPRHTRLQIVGTINGRTTDKVEERHETKAILMSFTIHSTYHDYKQSSILPTWFALAFSSNVGCQLLGQLWSHPIENLPVFNGLKVENLRRTLSWKMLCKLRVQSIRRFRHRHYWSVIKGNGKGDWCMSGHISPMHHQLASTTVCVLGNHSTSAPRTQIYNCCCFYTIIHQVSTCMCVGVCWGGSSLVSYPFPLFCSAAPPPPSHSCVSFSSSFPSNEIPPLLALCPTNWCGALWPAPSKAKTASHFTRRDQFQVRTTFQSELIGFGKCSSGPEAISPSWNKWKWCACVHERGKNPDGIKPIGQAIVGSTLNNTIYVLNEDEIFTKWDDSELRLKMDGRNR